jgi:Raf kinase inhibitor-like YbhB/YbcL family protein
MRRIISMTGMLLVGTVVVSACNDDGRTLRPARADQNASVSTSSEAPITDDLEPLPELETVSPSAEEPLQVTAPWIDGGVIDERYTCTGDNVVPGLTWSPAPEGTVEIAITMSDANAPTFVHWAMAGISPNVTALAEGAVPPGAIIGINTSGQYGYTGPCPPAGATHTYYITVHYLDQQIELASGAPGDDLRIAINLATAASTAASGIYTIP